MQCNLIDIVDDLTALVKLRDGAGQHSPPTKSKIGAMNTARDLLLKASSTLEGKAICGLFYFNEVGKT
jgi:hypothetical protein